MKVAVIALYLLGLLGFVNGEEEEPMQYDDVDCSAVMVFDYYAYLPSQLCYGSCGTDSEVDNCESSIFACDDEDSPFYRYYENLDCSGSPDAELTPEEFSDMVGVTVSWDCSKEQCLGGVVRAQVNDNCEDDLDNSYMIMEFAFLSNVCNPAENATRYDESYACTMDSYTETYWDDDCSEWVMEEKHERGCDEYVYYDIRECYEGIITTESPEFESTEGGGSSSGIRASIQVAFTFITVLLMVN